MGGTGCGLAEPVQWHRRGRGSGHQRQEDEAEQQDGKQ